MSKDPAFLFYFRDFLVSTELMTAEELGYYMRILCHMADKGRLTFKHMQSICKAYEQSYALHEHLKIDENGLYYHPRLESEIQKRRNYTQSRRENAKHMHKHMPKHMGNGNDNGNGDVFNKEEKPKKTFYKNPPTTDILQYFKDRHNSVTNKTYVSTNKRKDNDLLLGLIEILGEDEVKKKIDIFLKINDDFILKAGHTVAVFHSRINSLNDKKDKMNDLN